MRVTVKVKGLREVEQALAQLPKATGKSVLRKVAKGALEPMRDDARRRAPDDPATANPDLESSITIEEVKDDKLSPSSVSMKMGVPTAIFYGKFQEFGTVKMAANPFMRPAWDAGAQKALDYVVANLRVEIDRAAARLAKRRAKG